MLPPAGWVLRRRCSKCPLPLLAWQRWSSRDSGRQGRRRRRQGRRTAATATPRGLGAKEPHLTHTPRLSAQAGRGVPGSTGALEALVRMDLQASPGVLAACVLMPMPNTADRGPCTSAAVTSTATGGGTAPGEKLRHRHNGGPLVPPASAQVTAEQVLEFPPKPKAHVQRLHGSSTMAAVTPAAAAAAAAAAAGGPHAPSPAPPAPHPASLSLDVDIKGLEVSGANPRAPGTAVVVAFAAASH